jgi:phosphate butyryltransferase
MACLRTFDDIIGKIKGLGTKKRIVVAGADDPHVIESVWKALQGGLIAKPLLTGDVEKITGVIRDLSLNPADFSIVDNPAGMNSAENAVALIKDGAADFLMKGLIDTKDMLKPVVNKDNGLNTGKIMSHVVFNQVPSYHKLIVTTDGGMVTYPDLEQKVHILENAVAVLRRLGYEKPSAAVLTAVEKANPKMLETLDAEAMKKMAESGKIKDCFVEGPISYDIAMSREIAEIKKYQSPYCGDFDILLTPNIHAGNILGKSLVVSAGAKMAGIIAGAKIPIILTSRGSSAEEKYLSIALASAVSAGSDK